MTLLQKKENRFSAMARFSDVSSLDVSTKTTNQKGTQRERGRVTVLFIVLLILVTFIAVAVGITLSYVTRTDITRLHVTFSVKTKNNATVQPGSKQRDKEIGYTFCEKIKQAIYSEASWKENSITCHSSVNRNELDELYCSIILDCTSCKGQNDVNTIKQIVINVVEGSSGGYMEVVKGQSSKHTLNETKDRGFNDNENLPTNAKGITNKVDSLNMLKEAHIGQSLTPDPSGSVTSQTPKVTTKTKTVGTIWKTVLSTTSPPSKTTGLKDSTVNTRNDKSSPSFSSSSSFASSRTTITPKTTITKTTINVRDRTTKEPLSTESTAPDVNSWDKLLSRIMKNDVSFEW